MPIRSSCSRAHRTVCGRRYAGHSTRHQLLAATSASQASENWVVRGETRTLTLDLFSAVRDESYRLYHKVDA